MVEQHIIYLALNGVLVLIVSLASGHWFARAIIKQGNEVAWRVVHSSGCMTGIMLIVFSSLIPILVLPQWAMMLFAWSIIFGTWIFLIALIIAAMSGERGLKSSGSRINRGLFFSFIAGALLTYIGCSILLAGLIRAL